MRSAIHDLRNYQDEALGFILSASESEQQEFAIIQCANGPWVFSDKVRFHAARAALDRLLRIAISEYHHVSFWRGKRD